VFLGNEAANPRRWLANKPLKPLTVSESIVETAHQQALDILEHNRDLLETIANQLLETEVIEGEELHNLLSQVKSGTQVHPEVSSRLKLRIQSRGEEPRPSKQRHWT